jgi:rhodanese-related sulfurtransferase
MVADVSSQNAGNVAEPFQRVDLKTAQELIAMGDVQLIDVREPNEYREGHIPGVTLIPLNTLLDRPQDFLKRDNILFICAMGQRSALACEMAAALGFEQLYNLEGGTVGWAKAGLPIEKELSG